MKGNTEIWQFTWSVDFQTATSVRQFFYENAELGVGIHRDLVPARRPVEQAGLKARLVPGTC